MRSPHVRAVTLLVVLLVWTGSAHPASATIPATGTRLSIEGERARFYMTYGNMREPELYAPVTHELQRLGVTFQRRDQVLSVYIRGARTAEWPIVYSLEQVPDTGAEAVALNLGGNLFVPVRRLAGMVPFQVFWNSQENIVSLTLSRSAPRAPGVQPLQSPGAALPVELNSVDLVPQTGAVELRIRTSGPIVPQVLNLKAPARIAVDFPRSRWAAGTSLPEADGEIQAMRSGQPVPGTSRLTLEVAGPWVRVRSVRVDRDQVVLRVGMGAEFAQVEVTPAARTRLSEARDVADLRAVLQRRSRLNPRIASRSTPGTLDREDFTPGEAVPIPNPNELPSRLPPLRVQPASTLAGRVIVVDAGHGGADAGARGPHYYEKDLTLKAAQAVREALEARGALVIMTRETDVAVELSERPALANRQNAELFISIHCNSSAANNTARGVETYWHWRRPQSRRLAQALHRRLLTATSNNDRGIRSNRDLCVCREAGMPSVLLELGFIDNVQDEAQLASRDFQRLLAEELALGVLDFFGTDQ